jgi:hypothetical protein
MSLNDCALLQQSAIPTQPGWPHSQAVKIEPSSSSMLLASAAKAARPGFFIVSIASHRIY